MTNLKSWMQEHKTDLKERFSKKALSMFANDTQYSDVEKYLLNFSSEKTDEKIDKRFREEIESFCRHCVIIYLYNKLLRDRLAIVNELIETFDYDKLVDTEYGRDSAASLIHSISIELLTQLISSEVFVKLSVLQNKLKQNSSEKREELIKEWIRENPRMTDGEWMIDADR